MSFIWLLGVGRDEKIIKIYRQRYNSNGTTVLPRVLITRVDGGGSKGSRDHAIWDQFDRGVPVRLYQETCPQHPSQPSASLPLRSFIFSRKLEMSSSENSEALVLSSDPLHVRSAKF